MYLIYYWLGERKVLHFMQRYYLQFIRVTQKLCLQVSGIVGRADVLCTFFSWLSLIFYDRCIYAKQRNFSIFFLVSSIVCISVAMFCKEIGITSIAICGMYDILIVNKLSPYEIMRMLKFQFSWSNVKNVCMEKSSLIKRLTTLTFVGIILVSTRFSIMGFSIPTFQAVDNPAAFVDNFFDRVVNYNYIYCLNLWLLICPEWLCFDWSMGCIPLITGYDRRILAVFGFLIIIGFFIRTVISPTNRTNSRFVGMGLSLLIIPFLPSSNIFFTVGFVLAERTLYLPSAGYCLLVAVGLENIFVKFGRSKIPVFLYGILIVVYFGRSWIRSEQWRHEKSLFRSALGVCPLNAKVHYNIAKNAADLGDSNLAGAEYREALRLNPDYAQAMNNLGNLMKEQNKYEEAEKLFRRALELQQDFATAWMNLGIVLSALKRYNESEKSYETALLHRPICPDCYYNLGVSFLETKEHEKALQAWQKAIAQKATHRRAWVNWVRLLDDLGKPSEALKVARTGLKFIPDDSTLHFNIGNILGKAGRFEEAEIEFKEAISKDSKNPTILTNLGVLYHRWGKYEEAELMYKNALTIKPDLQSAKDNLKKLYSRQNMKARGTKIVN
ncbi:protein O-mannosyl-transferase TMTC4-like isoform X2 [Venturia canescens]|uniref:protein O-mannosyl-transferase TMTC4-like isoform X2 n=1 Tax=Venturia canescens TaxID=32260 RepID=UPI001C9D54F1|nr:protein O-mannosyl-transferase TMTC4-like isoform X2 [Venturia canescens]